MGFEIDVLILSLLLAEVNSRGLGRWSNNIGILGSSLGGWRKLPRAMLHKRSRLLRPASVHGVVHFPCCVSYALVPNRIGVH